MLTIPLYFFVSFGFNGRNENQGLSWFNDRKLPKAFIEVEHSTDIYRSLLKFFELQDFYADFIIAAPATRENEFLSKLSSRAFDSIKKRVKFWDYETVSKVHSNLSELALMKQF